MLGQSGAAARAALFAEGCMPHKLVALLFIFGTIALMVAWIPCVDCTTRFCQYVYDLLGRGTPPRAAGQRAERDAGTIRKAA
jgi:hypothetical protein